MVSVLKKRDFSDGGIFADVIIPTKMPIPVEIMKYTFGDQIFTCEKFLPKTSQMGLLKQIWGLKGFEMEWCPCKTEHLILIEEYRLLKRNFAVSQISKRDFTSREGMFYGKMDLTHTKTPLPNFVIEHLFGFMMDYYNSVPEGECFKSSQYHIRILKQIFGFFEKSSKVCFCSVGTHLIL